MRCPKCQREVSSDIECIYCGVIFSKYQKNSSGNLNIPPKVESPNLSDNPVANRDENFSPKKTFAKKAARASWIIVFINIGIMQFGKSVMNAGGDVGAIIFGAVIAVMFVIGIILGIIGITGWRVHGVKSTVAPGLIGIILNAGLLFLLSSVAISAYSSYYTKGIILRLSQNMNKQLPKMVDEETRLEKIAVGPDKKLSYLYTMVNYNGHEINRDDLKQSLAQKIQSSVCADKALHTLLQRGVTVVFSYNGRDGVLAFECPVTLADCGLSN